MDVVKQPVLLFAQESVLFFLVGVERESITTGNTFSRGA